MVIVRGGLEGGGGKNISGGQPRVVFGSLGKSGNRKRLKPFPQTTLAIDPDVIDVRKGVKALSEKKERTSAHACQKDQLQLSGTRGKVVYFEILTVARHK